MADKYLDINGLAYYKQKTDNQLLGKVDKETGKGLSTNDYTTDEKTKLSGIEAGAQVNVLEGIQVAGSSVSPVNKIANVPAMTGAASDAAGAAGVVPAPASGDHVKFLRGDGSWQDAVTSDNAVPPSRTINSHALSSDITLTPADIGALPDTTHIPEATTTTPIMDGTAAVGSETTWAKGDHVHPTDTSRAPLASPALTGTPTAPTATAGTDTTQIATTAFVNTAIANAAVGAATFKGTVNTGTDISGLTDYKKGWYWVVGTAGIYVGTECEVGDMIFCTSDFNTAYSASDFDALQTNLSITAITNAEIDNIFGA